MDYNIWFKAKAANAVAPRASRSLMEYRSMSSGTAKQMSLVTNFENFQAARELADVSGALWARLRQEAEAAFSRERALAPLFVNSILNRAAFEDALIHR